MNELIANEYYDLGLEQIEQTIITHSVNMAKSMLEIGKGLKAICDGKKYTEKGYDSFKDYMEDASAHTFPFSYSQARKHIRVYERFGGRLTELNCAKIEVLDILRDIPEEDFAELNDSGRLESMTKREAEELKDKLKAANEQLCMLTASNEQLMREAEQADKEYTALAEREDEYENRIGELNRKIKELENRPVETVIKEPTEEQIAEIRAAAQKEAEKEVKNARKLLKEAEKRLKTDEEAHKSELERLSSELGAEKSAADSKIKELERKLQSAEKPADAELIEFKFYFAETQDNLKKFISVLERISDTEKKKKFKGAAIEFVHAILNDLQGDDIDDQAE